MNEYIQSMAYKQWKNNKDGVIDTLQELMGKERDYWTEIYTELMIVRVRSLWEESWNDQRTWHLSWLLDRTFNEKEFKYVLGGNQFW